jgi:hypothetical protein
MNGGLLDVNALQVELEPLEQVPPPPGALAPVAATPATAATEEEEEGKGKKRRLGPPPLSETHLLSDAGFPFLLKEMHGRVGSCPPKQERAWLSRLLTSYREWGLKLYPRLAFEDLTSRIETLGSKQRMRNYLQEMRHREMERYLGEKYGEEVMKTARKRHCLSAEVQEAMASMHALPVFNRYAEPGEDEEGLEGPVCSPPLSAGAPSTTVGIGAAAAVQVNSSASVHESSLAITAAGDSCDNASNSTIQGVASEEPATSGAPHFSEARTNGAEHSPPSISPALTVDAPEIFGGLVWGEQMQTQHELETKLQDSSSACDISRAACPLPEGHGASGEHALSVSGNAEIHMLPQEGPSAGSGCITAPLPLCAGPDKGISSSLPETCTSVNAGAGDDTLIDFGEDE